MSTLVMATLGGLISFLSTSIGAVMGFASSRLAHSSRWSLSIDFALGLMVSASAFTLIGPAALDANSRGAPIRLIVAAVTAGAISIFFLKKRLDGLQRSSEIKTSQLLLATVLTLHNFPEGLASGATLAGLGWQASLPILGGISIQNVPEGALMVMSLRAMGWSPIAALAGGVGSGLVELAGGSVAGLVLQSTQGFLPVLLAFAGGAMIASVLVELVEGEGALLHRVRSAQFLMGFTALPLLQMLGS